MLGLKLIHVRKKRLHRSGIMGLSVPRDMCHYSYVNNDYFINHFDENAELSPDMLGLPFGDSK